MDILCEEIARTKAKLATKLSLRPQTRERLPTVPLEPMTMLSSGG